MSLITLNGSTIEGATDNEKWSTAYSTAKDGNTIGADSAVITGMSAGKSLKYDFDNTVFADGGQIALNMSGSTFTGSTFSGNSNTGHGGAMYAGGGNNVIDNSLFLENVSTQNGGAIRSYASKKLTLDGATFRRNTGANGGAFYAEGDGGTTTIVKGLYDGNFTSGSGGAIYVKDVYVIDVDGTSFTGNTAANGGALYVYYKSSMNIRNAVFSGNSATNGGALYAGSGTVVTISNSQFLTATDTIYNGGTMTLSGTNTFNASLSGTVSADNAAFIFGGTSAISLGSINGTVSAVTFANTGKVGFSSRDLSNTAVTITAAVLPDAGASFTVASGVAIGSNQTIDFLGHKDAVRDRWYQVSGGTAAKWTVSSNNLTVTAQDFSSETVYVSSSYTDATEKYGITKFSSLQDAVAARPDYVKAFTSDGGTFTSDGAVVSGHNIASGSGAAAVIKACAVNIQNSTFSGNTAPGSGAVHTETLAAGSLIKNTLFSGNRAAGTAGALRIYKAAGLTLDGATFSGNSSTGNGGAILSDSGGTVSYIGSVFTANRGSSGGAARIEGGLITVSGSTFSLNTASNSGAVHMETLTAGSRIENTLFTGNTASGSAGALRLYKAAGLTLDGATFSGNTSGSNGGAIYADGGTVAITGSTFAGNRSVSQGAGIYGGSAVRLTVSDSLFIGNNSGTADGAAIALLNSGTSLTLSGSTFSGNSAPNGGAVYAGGSTLLTISDCQFLTASDTIYNGGTATISGTNTVNASVKGSSYAADHASFIFQGAEDITLAGISGTIDAVTFANTGKVGFSSRDLSNTAVTITAAVLPDAGASFTVVSGVTLGSGQTIDFIDHEDTVRNRWYQVSGGTAAKWTISGNSLTVTAQDFSGETVYVSSSYTDATDKYGVTKFASLQDAIAARPDYTGSFKGNTGVFAAAGATVSGRTFSTSGAAVSLENTGMNISGSTFSGNTSTDGNGGALHSSVSAAGSVIADSLFAGNYAKSYGGALRAYKAGGLTVSGTLFSGNTAGSYGGAVYADASNNIGTSAFTGSTFSGNISNSNGGAVYFNAGTAAVTGTLFSGNTGSDGGALFGNGTVVTVSDTLFAGNCGGSNKSGGAAYFEGGTVTITGSTFADNTATASGAIHSQNLAAGSLIENTVFTGNSAAKSGGALRAYKAQGLTVSGSTFSGNYAAKDGGAVYTDATSGTTVKVAVAGSTFTGNVSVENGGALYAAANTGSALITIDTAVFSGNSSGSNGGASYFSGGTAAVTGSIFSGNTAASSGAIHSELLAAGSVIENTVFAGNTASDSAGALRAYKSAGLTVSGSTFSGNYAARKGGAVYADASGNVGTYTFDGDLFAGNGTAGTGNGGGAAYLNGGTVAISNSTFSGNYSGTNGGAIFAHNGIALNISGSLFTGNTVDGEGGGAVYLLNAGSSLTITGSTFSGNAAEYGAAVYGGGSTVLTITDCEFLTKSDSIYKGGILTFNGSNKLAGSVTGSGNVTISAGGTVTFTGDTFQSKLLTCDGVFAIGSDADVNADVDGAGEMVIASGSTVTFNGSTIAAKLVNNGTICVNGKLDDGTYTLFTYGSDWTVGTITAGENGDIYHVAADSKYYYYNALYVDSSITETEVGKEITITVDGTDTAVLNGVNAFTDVASAKAKLSAEKNLRLIIVNGSVDGNYYGEGNAKFYGGTVAKTTYGGKLVKTGEAVETGDTKLSVAGGTFCSMVVGGNRVSVDGGSAASVVSDTVTLKVTGGVFSDEKGYLAAAGYVVNDGNNKSTAASLSVNTANLTLDGEEVKLKKYAFGGAFAANGTATVETVNVVVANGTYESVFAGGWAQNGGAVEVTGATIAVTGGSIRNLYAGGTDSGIGNTTSVNAAEITVTGGSIRNLFLNGKYSRDTVTTATLNVTGECEINWIEGLCHSMAASSASTKTAVNIGADLTVEDILDVDEWNLTKVDTLLDFGIHTANLNGTLSGEQAVGTVIDFQIGEQSIGTEGWTAIAAKEFEGLGESSIKINGQFTEYSKESSTWTYGAYTVTLNNSYDDTRKALIVTKTA